MTIPNPLSEKTTAEIEALARKISVAEELDAEIQAELRGHIEDKVRDYVSGNVKVSEADAMLLATAHFGDAAVIKGMFQGVHAVAHAESLGRRLAAALVATLVVSTAIQIVELLWTVGILYPVATMTGERHVFFWQAFNFSFRVFSILLWMVLLWSIFAFWRKRQDQGRRIWFETWSPIVIGAMVLGLFAAQMAISNLLVSTLNSIYSEADIRLYFIDTSNFVRMMNLIVGCGAAMTEAFLWMWWTDRAPRTRRRLVYTLTCWIIASACIPFIPMALDMELHALERGEMSIRAITEFFFSTRSILPQELLLDALGGLVGLVAYLLFRRSKSVAVVA